MCCEGLIWWMLIIEIAVPLLGVNVLDVSVRLHFHCPEVYHILLILLLKPLKRKIENKIMAAVQYDQVESSRSSS